MALHHGELRQSPQLLEDGAAWSRSALVGDRLPLGQEAGVPSVVTPTPGSDWLFLAGAFLERETVGGGLVGDVPAVEDATALRRASLPADTAER
jgi:hypothetical protein